MSASNGVPNNSQQGDRVLPPAADRPMGWNDSAEIPAHWTNNPPPSRVTGWDVVYRNCP